MDILVSLDERIIFNDEGKLIKLEGNRSLSGDILGVLKQNVKEMIDMLEFFQKFVWSVASK